MKRRQFVKNSVLAASAFATPAFAQTAAAAETTAEKLFNLNYAPHDGMFKNLGGNDILDQIRFMADQGFRSFEDNGMSGRTPDMQEKIGKLLADKKMQMGVFVAHKIYWDKPNLANGNAELRKEFLDHIRNAVDVARRCNATWMTVVPGYVDLHLAPEYQTAHVVESLRRAAEILEPHNLIMVLEPLNFRDHPGQFLTGIPQTYGICKAVNSKSCKILYDLYHIQIQHGNLIPNIDLAWDETAYFQIGDNPGRKEPTTGEINYKNVFKHIHSKGYTGVLGMEHGNFSAGIDGEKALIAAYREVDAF